MQIIPARLASKRSSLVAFTGVLALFCAAPLFSQPKAFVEPRIQDDQIRWFTLDETPAQILEKLGPVRQVGELGPNYLIWQFQIDVADTHEFSHVICIRKSGNKIVSVARNYEEPENVDALFPPEMSEVHHWMKDGKPGYSVRVRKLNGDRLLIAVGSAKPGERTSQLLLIHREELKLFMPWLDKSLAKSDLH